MSAPVRYALLVVAVVAVVVGVLAAWHFFGPVAVVGGAAAAAVAVGAARRTVRSERRSAGRRHVEEVREVERLQERDGVVTAPLPDDSDEQERIRRITDRAADRRRRSRTGQAP